MPGLDKTGPMGQGSKTGRRMGKCKPENVSEGLGRGESDGVRSVGGRGRGRGLGKGRGLGAGLETGRGRGRGGLGRGRGRQD